MKLLLPVTSLLIFISCAFGDSSGEIYFWVEGEKLEKSIGNSQETSGGQFLAVKPSSGLSRKIILPGQSQYHTWLRYFDMVGSISKVMVNETQYLLEGSGKGWLWKELGGFEDARVDIEIVNEKGLCNVDVLLFTTDSAYKPSKEVPISGNFDFRQATSNYPSLAIVYAHKIIYQKMDRNNYPYQLLLSNLDGWNVSIYENFKLAQLVRNLDNYHIIFFDAGVNLTSLKTYEKEFISFVRKGGILFITEISDEKEAGLVSEITGRTINLGITDRIYPGKINDGFLTVFPNNLKEIEFTESPPILYSLRKYSNNLCYFKETDKKDKIWFFSKEGNPLIITSELDKGTIVLTTLFSGLGQIGELLENLWSYRCFRQGDFYIKDFLPERQHDGWRVQLKIVNEGSIDKSLKLFVEMDREKWFEKKERVNPGENKVMFEFGNISSGKRFISWYLVDEESGRLCWTDSGDIYIPPLIQIELDQLVYNSDEAELSFTIQANFSLNELENLKYSVKIDDNEMGEFPPMEKLEQKGSLNIKDLSTGEHTLQVDLSQGRDVLANSQVNFQKVDIREPVHQVTIKGEDIKIDGESTFLFGFYGVYRKNLNILKEAGFNFAYLIDHDNQSNEAYKQGIKVQSFLIFPYPEDTFVQRASSARLSPGLVFRTLCEEPICDLNNTKQFLQEKNKIAKKYDPFHPTVLLLPPGECVPQYVEIPDIIMIDDYPVRAKDGSLDGIGSTIENCRQTTIKSCGYAKPILMCLQAHSWALDGLIIPSPAQVRVMTYLSIVHQAKGIIYFIFDEQPPETYLSAIHYKDGHFQEPLWSELKKLASEIKKLNPILVSSDVDQRIKVNNPKIHILCKEYNGRKYIFAVNPFCEKIDSTLSGINGNKAKVLFEEREIGMTSGSFNDNFTEYGVHIYEIY